MLSLKEFWERPFRQWRHNISACLCAKKQITIEPPTFESSNLLEIPLCTVAMYRVRQIERVERRRQWSRETKTVFCLEICYRTYSKHNSNAFVYTYMYNVCIIFTMCSIIHLYSFKISSYENMVGMKI